MRYDCMAGIFFACALLSFEPSYADQAPQPQFSETKARASQATTTSASSAQQRETNSPASQDGTAESRGNDRPGGETRVRHSKNAQPLARHGNIPLAANEAASRQPRRAINSQVTAPRPVRRLLLGTRTLKAPAPALPIVPHRAPNPAAIGGNMNARARNCGEINGTPAGGRIRGF
jgi:hypothetical protein